MEYGASRFPMSSHFFLTANEKDFSLALEMTVREGCSHFPSMFSGHKSLIYKETYIHARTF